MITTCFEQRTKTKVHKLAMMCWMVWKGRNELVWNQKSLEVIDVVQYALSVRDHWKSAWDKTFDPLLSHMTHEDGHEHWQLPALNRIKINTDATSNCYSHAFVVQNHNGELNEAESKYVRGQVILELAEVTGVREALSWVKKKADCRSRGRNRLFASSPSHSQFDIELLLFREGCGELSKAHGKLK